MSTRLVYIHQLWSATPGRFTNVFSLHSVVEIGRAAIVRPAVTAGRLIEVVANLPPCTIGTQACSGAHQ